MLKPRANLLPAVALVSLLVSGCTGGGDPTLTHKTQFFTGDGVTNTFPLLYLPQVDTVEVHLVAVDNVGDEFAVAESATDGWSYHESADQSEAEILFAATVIPAAGTAFTVEYDLRGMFLEPDTAVWP